MCNVENQNSDDRAGGKESSKDVTQYVDSAEETNMIN